MKNYFLIFSTLFLSSCATHESLPCPPKSETQIIADTISDILVPKIKIGGC